MKSEKSGNKRKNKKETRGRKTLEKPSIQVSWRIPHDIYQLLEAEQKILEEYTGLEFPLSKVLASIVKKELKKD